MTTPKEKRQYPGGPPKSAETPEQADLNLKCEQALLSDGFKDIDALLEKDEIYFRVMEQRITNVIDKINVGMTLHLKRKYKKEYEFVLLRPAFLAGRIDILGAFKNLGWIPDNDFLGPFVKLVARDVEYDLQKPSSRVFEPLKQSFLWSVIHGFLDLEVLPIDYFPDPAEFSA